MDIPPVRYARSGDVRIAYQVTGYGNPIDLVFAPGTVSHLSLAWDRPLARMQIERLSRFARLIRFDKRGTGMSDRMVNAATLEERTDDIRASWMAPGANVQSSSALLREARWLASSRPHTRNERAR